MLKRKKVVSLLMASVLALSATGCGNEETSADPSPTPSPTPTEAPADPTPTPTEAPADPTPTTAPLPTEAPSYAAGYVADFEDGNYGFIAVKESMANSAQVELSVVDFKGSKAVKAEASDTSKVPYVAIDISSLAGDAIESVRSIEMDLGLLGADGNFYAASGSCFIYTGEENKETETSWSVYLDTKNPRRVTFTIAADQAFAAGAKNIIMLTKKTDNAVDSGSYSTLYIDNIVLKDADGNAVAVNAAAGFDAPDGFADQDWSNLVQVKDEVILAGMEGTTGGSWWPASGISTDPNQPDANYVDPASFGPGMIMTIYMSFDSSGMDDWQKNIKLVGQYWTVEGSEIPAPNWEAFSVQDVAELTVGTDGSMSFNVYALPMNDSCSIAQISYDEIAQYLGEDWFSYVKFLGVADYGFPLSISAVTAGYEKKVLPATVKDVTIEGFSVKEKAWAQAGVDRVEDGGTFDHTLLKPGTVVTINYKSEGSMWLVAVPVEGASFDWSRIADGGAANTNDDNTACQITYEQIVEALGTDDLSQIAKLQCESDQPWEVYSVTIGEFAPDPIPYTNEIVLEGSAVKKSAWAQDGVIAVAAGGTFDYTLLQPGTVVNIRYKENGGNYWLVVANMEGAPYVWTRIEQNTARTMPDKGLVQITYEQIVAALGSDDLSYIYALQCESDQDWEVYSISIATVVGE